MRHDAEALKRAALQSFKERPDLAERLQKEIGNGSKQSMPIEATSGVNQVAVGSLATRCMADVEAKPISWLWPGRIARGKLTILAGNPGLGKSQLCASIAAFVTTGGKWPVDGSACPLGSVLFVNREE